MAETKNDTSFGSVELGFVEQTEAWLVQSCQFPSKVGGKPAWLSMSDLPNPDDLLCNKCRQPVVFLLQIYAPFNGKPFTFHRSLFVFICKNPQCYAVNDNRCFKVFRSQLARKNDFYPYDPPKNNKSDGRNTDEKETMQSYNIKLCSVCGCLAPKSCSQCHMARYCSREHQLIHWKAGHKQQCSKKDFSDPSVPENTFLFPEYLIVTELEELTPEKSASEVNDETQQYLPTEKNSSDDCDCVNEKDLEAFAKHESLDIKVFTKFKERISNEPDQILRYCKGGSPLWVCDKIPSKVEIPNCDCGAERVFEFQIMPQLLNHLNVDHIGASIDWGTLVIYTCKDSCDQGNRYTAEFLWKQDFSSDDV
ncbi:programmed cell death protein 2 isoform X1 [Polypterus senegalus]|nr:programmed cell death protein 2 isoform X1 [Polypterus senegalus]